MADTARRTLSIVRLGRKGDGESGDGVHVPYTVDGDMVEAVVDDGRGHDVTLMTPSPHRIAPPCAHFGRCGGCALQHIRASYLAEWKREQIAQALSQHGLRDVLVAQTWTAPPKSRRRAELHARLTDHELKLGFLQRGTRVVVDMEMCELLTPKLFSALPTLRRSLAAFLPRHRHVAVHMLETIAGLDLALGIPDFTMTANARAAAGRMADELDLARLSVNAEPIIQRREPVVMIAGVPVIPPPEGFLQAAAEAEATLQSFTRDALRHAKSVADIFAGCGTFALDLARGAKVHALESDMGALAALSKAARMAQNRKLISTEKRDLFRRPLIAQELDAFDAVVIDPPRPGAKPQCEQIAASRLKSVVYISCNVVTFARDAEVLTKGGFELKTVQPVDQFLWSPHIELAAEFRR